MSIGDLLQLARQIFNRRQTKFLSLTHVIAVGSVAISSAALLLALGILSGFEQELQSKTSLFIGHLDAQITSKHVAPSFQQWTDRLRMTNPAIERVVAYTELEALLAHHGNVEAAVIHADTPLVTERLVALAVDQHTIMHEDALALGRPLAERLGVKVGDTIAMFLSQPQAAAQSAGLGFPLVRRVRIGAVFESGMRQFDETIALAGASLVRTLRLGRFVPTGFTLWLKYPDQSRVVAGVLDSLYGSSLYVRTYREIHPAMFTWIALQKRPIPIIVGILSVVAAFNILTLLFVVIVERRHAIAILRLLGLDHRRVLGLITAYGAWIGSMGYALGLVISLTIGYVQQAFGIVRLDADVYFIDRLPIAFGWWHAAIVGGVVMVLSLVVAALPAYAATRISPLVILRIK
ncbi:MAG: permease [Candidatus Kapaibacterium sp.]|nr:MAG: permease [Candidatus Kapabacteria bacterium]